jgi:hypothetical protein
MFLDADSIPQFYLSHFDKITFNAKLCHSIFHEWNFSRHYLMHILTL